MQAAMSTNVAAHRTSVRAAAAEMAKALPHDGCVSSRRASCRYLVAVDTSSKPNELTAYLANFCASVMAVSDGEKPGAGWYAAAVSVTVLSASLAHAGGGPVPLTRCAQHTKLNVSPSADMVDCFGTACADCGGRAGSAGSPGRVGGGDAPNRGYTEGLPVEATEGRSEGAHMGGAVPSLQNARLSASGVTTEGRQRSTKQACPPEGCEDGGGSGCCWCCGGGRAGAEAGGGFGEKPEAALPICGGCPGCCWACCCCAGVSMSSVTSSSFLDASRTR